MSDTNSGLPIRSQLPGQVNYDDVIIKVGDATNPDTQQLAVDTAGKVFAKLNDGSGNDITSQANGAQQALDVGINVAGVQIDPRDIRALTNADVVTVEQGTSPWVISATDLDIRDLVFATDKVDVSGSAIGVTNLPATVDTNYGAVGASTIRTASQVGNATGAANFNNGATGAQTLRVAANLAVAGADVTSLNPVPVTITDATPGTPVNDYATSAAVAAGATVNHDYTVTAAKTLYLNQIEAAASGKMKIEVMVETAVASGIFNTRWVQFNSTATPNMMIHIDNPVAVAAGVRVRVVSTNKDNQSQDLYSTISGYELP